MIPSWIGLIDNKPHISDRSEPKISFYIRCVISLYFDRPDQKLCPKSDMSVSVYEFYDLTMSICNPRFPCWATGCSYVFDAQIVPRYFAVHVESFEKLRRQINIIFTLDMVLLKPSVGQTSVRAVHACTIRGFSFRDERSIWRYEETGISHTTCKQQKEK